MIALRNQYNYRQMPKRAAPMQNRPNCANEFYAQAEYIERPPNPTDILLRTARAERALYLGPEIRHYETDVSRAAVTANNLGIKCLNYDLPRAFRHFLDAVELAPDFALAHNNLGLAYLMIGATHMAVHQLDQAIEADPNLDIAYSNRGLAQLEQGEFNAAHQDFRTAISLDRNDPMHHNNMGVLWLDNGHPEAAIACFKNAIRLDDQFPSPWRNIGYAYRELGDYAAAAEKFDIAYELEEPQFPSSQTII